MWTYIFVHEYAHLDHYTRNPRTFVNTVDTEINDQSLIPLILGVRAYALRSAHELIAEYRATTILGRRLPLSPAGADRLNAFVSSLGAPQPDFTVSAAQSAPGLLVTHGSPQLSFLTTKVNEELSHTGLHVSEQNVKPIHDRLPVTIRRQVLVLQASYIAHVILGNQPTVQPVPVARLSASGFSSQPGSGFASERRGSRVPAQPHRLSRGKSTRGPHIDVDSDGTLWASAKSSAEYPDRTPIPRNLRSCVEVTRITSAAS